MTKTSGAAIIEAPLTVRRKTVGLLMIMPTS
jgi:hypothetical protein